MSKSKIIQCIQWRRLIDGVPMMLTVRKVKNGIIQRMYLDHQLIQKTFSKRPYRLGQVCDGTIQDCVYGLLILYCRAHPIDLEQLLAQAYPDQPPFTEKYQKATLQCALEQGIVIPDQWDDMALNGLIDSLTEINCHTLADRLISATSESRQ